MQIKVKKIKQKEDKEMTCRGIITGTALTKNTPIEAISLNSKEADNESEQAGKH